MTLKQEAEQQETRCYSYGLRPSLGRKKPSKEAEFLQWREAFVWWVWITTWTVMVNFFNSVMFMCELSSLCSSHNLTDSICCRATMCYIIYLPSQTHRHGTVCVFLWHLRAVPVFGPALCAVCELLELTVARWFCLGWFCPAVQLASCTHGVWAGSSVWQW